MPSTLLRLWEGQCLHKAAPRQRGGPASFSQVSTRFFQAGDVQPESQPEASQKPTKPLLIARSQPNQASRGLIWQGSLGLAGSQAFSGRPTRSTPGLLRKPAWNCAIYFALPRQRGGPASFSQVSARFFQAGGCPTRKPARSQPEANQTSFDSQKPAKPGKQRPDLARQPGPCRELRKCSLFRDVQGDRRLGCFASPRVELRHLLCPPQAAGRSSQLQPGKCEIFSGRGMSNQKASQKPARSQPEANQTSFDSQKPAKPGKQRPDLARQPGPCRELRKCSLFRDVQGDRRLGCFASPRVELCHLLCPPRQRGGPASFSQVSARFFQPESQPEASQKPEANQTSFDSQKPAKPGKQRPDLARQPCREVSFVCAP